MVELAGVVILGVLAQWIAWRTRVPAILPLIVMGLCIGPIAEYYFGHKFIDPVYSAHSPHGLFPQHSFFHFIELSIGIILFEGGLTLRRKEIAEVGPSILRLITLGSLVTFIGAGLAAYFILGLSLQVAFLFGSLVIVTGPTVIAPILRNVPLNKNVGTVLKWEGILIDPIGALAAVLVFEFILAGLAGHTAQFTQEAFINFFQILFTGFAVGFGMAYFLYVMLKNKLIPHYLIHVFPLALVLGAFVLSNIVAHDSGLLTVVVMGMTLGNMEVPHFKNILDFKESITILLISILFIVLSANINVEQLMLINVPMLIVFAILVFVIRPLGVFLSTHKSALNVNEKLFISWVGPRGIVAAGIASLFGLKLTAQGVPGAEIIAPFVFLVVLGTVILNATTARFMARILKVTLAASDGVIIIGASAGARLIGKYLKDNGRQVVLVDRSAASIKKAKAMGLECIEEDVIAGDLTERFELLSVGYLLALTSNDYVNATACEKYQDNFGENGTYRIISEEEKLKDVLVDQTLFSSKDDILKLTEIARYYPTFHEVPIQSRAHYDKLIELVINDPKTVPTFIKRADGKIWILEAKSDSLKIKEGDKLVYLGEALNTDSANVETNTESDIS